MVTALRAAPTDVPSVGESTSSPTGSVPATDSASSPVPDPTPTVTKTATATTTATVTATPTPTGPTDVTLETQQFSALFIALGLIVLLLAYAAVKAR